MSLTTLYGEMQDTYLALIRTFPLRPIRSEGELDEAMEILDTLVGKDTLTAAEADYQRCRKAPSFQGGERRH